MQKLELLSLNFDWYKCVDVLTYNNKISALVNKLLWFCIFPQSYDCISFTGVYLSLLTSIYFTVFVLLVNQEHGHFFNSALFKMLDNAE